MTKNKTQPLVYPEDSTIPNNTSSLSKFIYPYGPKREVKITFPENGKAKQAFREECDINTIMARYMKTGLLEHVAQRQARYLDVTGADFQAAQNLVAGATSMFFDLPSHIRERFDNSPAEFLEFMENPANAQEAAEMGLRTAQAESGTTPTDPAPKTAPAASTPNVGASGGAGDKEPKGEKP